MPTGWLAIATLTVDDRLPIPADLLAAFGLGPDPAQAAYCASNPTFTGKLTQQLVDSGTP